MPKTDQKPEQNIIITRAKDNNVIALENTIFSFRSQSTNKPKSVSEKHPSRSQRYPLTINGINTYLTKQETRCINCFCQGMTIKDTAAQLKLATGTVNFYLANILRKAKLHKKKELIISIKKNMAWNTLLI